MYVARFPEFHPALIRLCQNVMAQGMVFDAFWCSEISNGFKGPNEVTDALSG